MEAENTKNGWEPISRDQALSTKRQPLTAPTRTAWRSAQIAPSWRESRLSSQKRNSTKDSGWNSRKWSFTSTSAVASTPYELWHGTAPNLSHLRIIGSTAYIHVPKEKRTKLDTHSHKGIMIGYGGGTNQYKVWDLTRDDIVVSRDVVFIE